METIITLVPIILPPIAIYIKYYFEKKVMGRKIPKPRQIVVSDLIDTSIIDRWKEYHFAPMQNDISNDYSIKIKCPNCGATKLKNKNCGYCGT
jgi:hypothetical protein